MLAALMLLGLSIGWLITVVPSFQGWCFDDDVRNMRWVLEYRGTPWEALTGLHSMHDHVRPAMLMATWAGAVISNGAWWGPHLVLVGLHLLGIIGLGVLAQRLSGRFEAGVAAVFLAMSLDGYIFMVQWNAWICSAGELACGFWGLVLIHRAFVRNRWPWAGLGLLVLAGLFKEPGWVVYPLAVVAMAWQLKKPVTRRRLAALASLPIGLTGLALTWHPTNVFRTVGPSSSLWDRLRDSLTVSPLAWTDNTFILTTDSDGTSSGITIVLLAFALLGALWLPRKARKGTAFIWFATAAAMTVGGFLAGQHAGLVLLAAALVVLVRNWRKPPLGLVIVWAGLGVMAPFESAAAVQVLSGGYGLALFTGCMLVKLWKNAPLRVPVQAIIFMALLLEGAQFIQDTTFREPVRNYNWLESNEDAYLGVGAMSRGLNNSWAVPNGDLGAMMISELIGVRLVEGRQPDPPTILVNEAVFFTSQEQEMDELFVGPNLLDDVELPIMRDDRTRPMVRPRGKNKSDQAGLLAKLGAHVEDLEPGFYALGIYSTGESDENIFIRATDGCGRLWNVDTDAASADVHMTTVHVREGCETLRLSQSGATYRIAPQIILAPLPEPQISLWAEPIRRHRLDVKVDPTGQVPGLYGTQKHPPKQK